MYVYVCVYIYIYMYTHTHTHTYIYIYLFIYLFIYKLYVLPLRKMIILSLYWAGHEVSSGFSIASYGKT